MYGHSPEGVDSLPQHGDQRSGQNTGSFAGAPSFMLRQQKKPQQPSRITAATKKPQHPSRIAAATSGLRLLALPLTPAWRIPLARLTVNALEYGDRTAHQCAPSRGQCQSHRAQAWSSCGRGMSSRWWLSSQGGKRRIAQRFPAPCKGQSRQDLCFSSVGTTRYNHRTRPVPPRMPQQRAAQHREPGGIDRHPVYRPLKVQGFGATAEKLSSGAGFMRLEKQRACHP